MGRVVALFWIFYVALIASDLVVEKRLWFPKELGIVAPRGLAIESDRGIVVSDEATHRIFVLKFGESRWKVLAGSKDHGDRDSQFGAARFAMPQGISVARSGDIIVADSANNKIKIINATNSVKTLVGSGESGNEQLDLFTSKLNEPAFALEVGNGEYWILDTYNHQILSAKVGELKKIFGNGMGLKDGSAKRAQFAAPTAMCNGSNDNKYVADTYNHAIRKIAPNTMVTTVAGNANSGFKDGTNAMFSFPMGVACDRDGTIYVADTGNDAIRKIAPDGSVTTIVSDGLNEPTAILVDNSGKVVVLEQRSVIIYKKKNG